MAATSFKCFDFVSEQKCFLHSQPSFSSAGLSFVSCARFAVYYLAAYSVLGSLIKQTLTATATSTMAV